MKLISMLLAACLVAATLLPLLRYDAWWIRVFEFPRVQIAMLGLVITIVYAMTWGIRSGSFPAAVLAVCILCLLYQGYRIFPYTPLARAQVVAVSSGDPERRLSLLIWNVLMENRVVEPFLAQVRATDPDVILVVETDRWWEQKLSSLEQAYPYKASRPQDNTYGIILYSRLPLKDSEVRTLVEDKVPSIYSRVQLRTGHWLELHGLHPKPPAPQESEDTVERDAELLIVGKAAATHDNPVIVAGDLNDVAWSYTTRLFQKISGLLDPRIGRGMFNTFSARNPLLRFPLDHVFLSGHFQLRRMERLEASGSDHFPVLVELSFEPGNRHRQAEPEAEPEDRQQAQEKIDKAR